MTGMIDGHTRGVFVIAAVPFDEARVLDIAGADPMVDFYLSAGADGLTILGMMGRPRNSRPTRARSLSDT